MDLIKKLYGWFLKASASLQSPFLLAVRLYWGWQFAQNGWAKLHNLENVASYFASLGLPMPGTTAVVISSTELLGG
ncbi:MAG: DoxX family protein, partial [Candidatus Acidiferrales bacterium]